MKRRSRDFRVSEGEAVNPKHRPTAIEPVDNSKKHYKERLEDHFEKLSASMRRQPDVRAAGVLAGQRPWVRPWCTT
jgi:hypothetical protein